MKRLALVGGLVVAIAIAIIALRHDRARDVPTTQSSRATTTGTGSAPASRPPAHVQQVTREERTEIAERIAAAHAARASAHSATPRPSLPPAEHAEELDVEHLKTDLVTAMKEAIPFLAACYKENAPGHAKTAVAMMTLTGDPDIGTVIDADQMYDENQRPLEAKLDACLRDTMETLQLPPLDQGDEVQVQYSFDLGDD